jgi:hypothetical protein
VLHRLVQDIVAEEDLSLYVSAKGAPMSVLHQVCSQYLNKLIEDTVDAADHRAQSNAQGGYSHGGCDIDETDVRLVRQIRREIDAKGKSILR